MQCYDNDNMKKAVAWSCFFVVSTLAGCAHKAIVNTAPSFNVDSYQTFFVVPLSQVPSFKHQFPVLFDTYQNSLRHTVSRDPLVRDTVVHHSTQMLVSAGFTKAPSPQSSDLIVFPHFSTFNVERYAATTHGDWYFSTTTIHPYVTSHFELTLFFGDTQTRKIVMTAKTSGSHSPNLSQTIQDGLANIQNQLPTKNNTQ